MRGDKGRAPFALRVYVPEEREVWLKYGVRDTSNSSGFGKTLSSPDFESGLLRQSPIVQVGPHEERLSPGHHVLSITIGDVEAGSLRLQITLDSIALVDSSLESARRAGSLYIASKPEMQQIDFEDGELHWGPLMSATMSEDLDEDPTWKLRVLVWLGNESSGFSAFPGSQ